MQRDVVSHRSRALLLAGVVGLLLAAGAPPGEARPVPPRPTVELGSVARLAVDGKSVEVDLIASCPEKWTVVEAVVTVSQGQASGEAPFPLTCTGGNKLFTVTLPSPNVPFQLGEAQAAASVVIQRGRTEQAQDSRVVRVVPTVAADLADTALLEGGGEAASIEVTVACPVGASGQQSYVNISQGPASGFGFFVPTCDGQPHTFTVRVQASQGLFQAGSAQGSAFVVVEAGGDVFFGEDNQPMQIIAT